MASKVGLEEVVVDKYDIDDDEVWRATLAVGGMTCASCSGAISEELKMRSWIRDVAVNLIANRATVDFIGRDKLDQIVKGIEDIGYAATIDTVERLNGAAEAQSRLNSLRTIEIQVDGMFCQHCPSNVLNALRVFEDRIKVEKPLTVQDPVLKISYTPEIPTFTIRTILSAISQVDLLKPSVFHPPTLGPYSS